MSTFTQFQERSELRLIGGVFALILTTFLVGLGLLLGAERRGQLDRLVQSVSTILPAERALAKRSVAADRPIAPIWSRQARSVLLANAGATTPESRPAPRAQRLRGHVRLPVNTPSDERPVVVATERRPTAALPPDARRAEVAPDGSFEIPLLPGEKRVWLTLEARYLRLDGGRRVSLAHRSEDDAIVLVPQLGARITGQVTAAVGARVELSSTATGAAFARAEVTESGFEFGGLAPDRALWIRTVAEGLRAEPPQAFRLRPGERRAFDLELVPFASAQGFAFGADGEPLIGASVFARPAHRRSGRGDITSTTDETGQFALEGLDPGSWLIFLDEHETERVELEPGEALLDLRLGATATLPLKASVRWPDEAPAANARVTLSNEQGRRITLTADESGLFEASALSEGTWRMIVLAERQRSSGALSVGGIDRLVSLPSDEPIALVLDGRGSIEGRFEDELGRTVDEIHVTISMDAATSFEATFEGSRFLLEGLPPGTGDLRVEDRTERGSFATHATSVRVPLARGEQRRVAFGERAKRETDEPALEVALSGQLRLGEEPIAGELWLSPKTGTTLHVKSNPFGRFTIDSIAAGPVDVRVLLAGFGEPIERALLIPRETTHRVELRFATGALEGEVRGPDESALAGLPVVARVAGAQSSLAPTRTAQTTTDAAGRFFLPFLESGAWIVTIDGTSSGLARTHFPAVEIGGAAHGRRYDLRPGGELVGRVESSNGQPLAGARIFGTRGEHWVDIGAETDAEGNWSASSVELGGWQLIARAPNAVSSALEVTLGVGERRSVPALQLVDAAALRVLPSDPNGTPVEAWVELLDENGKRLEDRASRPGDGTLRFAPLAAGTYWLRATDSTGRSVIETLELTGLDRDLTLTFE